MSCFDATKLVQSALHDVAAPDRERICKIFKESKIDGFALASLTDITDLMKVIPEVAPGYLVRIYHSLKCQTEKSYDDNMDFDDVEKDSFTSQSFTSQSEEDCLVDKSIPPLMRTDSFMPSGVELAQAILPSFDPSTSTADAVVEVDSNQDTLSEKSTSIATGSTDTNDLLPIPKDFPINKCQFGFYAKELIRTGHLTEMGKRQVLNELVRVMKIFESHPGRILRRKAVDSLVQLGRAQLMLTKHEAKQFWLHKVSQKINAEAKRLQKFQNSPLAKSKRAANNISGVSSTSPKRKACVSSSMFFDNSVNEKKQLIKEEMRKPVELRRKKDISEMMLETFNARRAFVKNSNPSAAIMKDEWPGLLIYDELILEMRRMINFASEREVRSEARNLFTKVINFAKSKMRKSAGLLGVLNELPLCDCKDMSLETLVVIGCWTLCHLLKSNTKKTFPPHRYFIDVYPVNTTTDEILLLEDRHQPVLVLYGKSKGGVKIEKLMLFSEKEPLFQVDDIVKGLLAYFAYHYVANYEYSPHTKKVGEFLEAELLRSAASKCSAVKELVMYLQPSESL